jgi:hypothetical protein
VDVNTILTIFAAPTDCKDLIRALAVEVRELRNRNLALVRELEAAQMALDSMTGAHDSLLDDNAKLFAQVTALEQGTTSVSEPMTRAQILQVAYKAQRQHLLAHVTYISSDGERVSIDTYIDDVDDSGLPIRLETAPVPCVHWCSLQCDQGGWGIVSLELV